MRAPLYIGVTGFMTPQEVRAGLRCFEASSDRKLMVGVLVSSKTLVGNTNKWPARYPKVDSRITELFEKQKLDAYKVFQRHECAVNLIHYNTDDPKTLSDQLIKLAHMYGPYLDGFQLNIAWPHMGEIEKLHAATHWEQRLVLQVGGHALDKVDHDPKKLADMIGHYGGSVRVINDVLIDPSGGKGQPFDAEKALSYLKEIASRGFDINLGIAGGLGPESMALLNLLLDDFPDLNIDAEGQLRDKETDDLDIIKMSSYLTQAQQWFATTSRGA